MKSIFFPRPGYNLLPCTESERNTMESTLKCASCKQYLLKEPRQLECGDRICGNCFLQLSKETSISCPSCQLEMTMDNCFRDKAVELQLASTVLECTNTGCKWTGSAKHINDHLKLCEFAVVNCPNMGCKESVYRDTLKEHLSTCRFTLGPVQCQLCGEISENQAVISGRCPACASQLGDAKWNTLTRVKNTKQQLASLLKEVDKIELELVEEEQPWPVVDAMVKVESTVQQLQEGFGEMALMVQTPQATSYSGTFIWKIREVRRRRNEAKAGKTISLYSAPFYTSRHGYKLCLRLYMDGDGSGKGTHLSFFLTIMRGEYDTHLPWPFRQTVTLMLMNQDKQHIIQSFRPEPTSSSFQRPHNEMNVASGCPTFAPLSVLSNSSYVKDDTVVLLFKVHGLNAGTDPGYLAGQSSSDPERYHPDKDTRKLRRPLKYRKRGYRLVESSSSSTTPTSDHPASLVSEAGAGSLSPDADTHEDDGVSFPLPVYTTSESEGSDPHNVLVYRLPVTEPRILLDLAMANFQRGLLSVLDDPMVDPATRVWILELIEHLNRNPRKSSVVTPHFFQRQRSITAPPVTEVNPGQTQLAV